MLVNCLCLIRILKPNTRSQKVETVACQTGTGCWYWYAYSISVLEAGGYSTSRSHRIIPERDTRYSLCRRPSGPRCLPGYEKQKKLYVNLRLCGNIRSPVNYFCTFTVQFRVAARYKAYV